MANANLQVPASQELIACRNAVRPSVPFPRFSPLSRAFSASPTRRTHRTEYWSARCFGCRLVCGKVRDDPIQRIRDGRDRSHHRQAAFCATSELPDLKVVLEQADFISKRVRLAWQ